VNSLNQLEEHWELLVQFVNPFRKPVQLLAGFLVGKFYSMQEENLRLAMETAEKKSEPSGARPSEPGLD